MVFGIKTIQRSDCTPWLIAPSLGMCHHATERLRKEEENCAAAVK